MRLLVIVEYNSLLFRMHLCLEGFQNVRDTEAATGWILQKRYSVKKAFSGLLTDGGGQVGPLPKICQTYPTMTKLYSYTLPKEDPKIIWITWHIPRVLLTSAFFHQEIQIYIAFWYIIYNSFNFSWVFEDFFNKSGYDFDDVSKNSYPRPSLNTGILKWKLWRHNPSWWRHQQNVITLFKLYCRCVNVSKFGTLTFLWKKLSQPQFYEDSTRRTAFFEGWSWLKFNNLGLALGTKSKFTPVWQKG